MIEILPTYVPRDLQDLAAGVGKIRSFASTIHVDVDDGIFAPHVTWPYTAAGVFGDVDLAPVLGFLYVEVHLMVEEPRQLGVAFARAGAQRVVGHVEGFADTEEAHGALDAWRENGAKEVGLGLLLHTPLEVIEPLIPACDVVHMMAIATIGTQGIPYDARVIARIRDLRERHPELLISVDGGVSENNVASLVKAGARRFGVGSAIMRADDPKAAYENLKSIAESAL